MNQPANPSPTPLFNVFVRDWWRDATPSDGQWPDNRVPYPGAPREYLAEGVTEDEARALCAEYRAANDPGRYSRKAEFESAD